MNGRVYDPLVSRFLSPDLFVQAPGKPQSFNRYAYVFNNPLSYTDPSGYIGIPQQYFEGSIEVDNTSFWVNHNPLNHGFGGGSGSGSSFGNSQTGYGLPGFGGNGPGVNGIYYDLVSGAFRYVSNPGRVVIGGFWLDVPLSEKVNEGLNGKLPGRWIIGGGIRSIYVNQGLGIGDDAANGGGNDWLDPTLNYSSKANGGLATATGAREVLEWEYIRQARINRALSGNYSQTVKHSMRAIKAVGKFTGVASMGISWADYANNPTTGNLIQAIANTGLVFVRVNPITGIIIGFADVTGASDYVYDQIGDFINHF